MYIATRRNKRGDVRYYWYKSVRKGKGVTGEYVRPASDLEAEEYFKTCATDSQEKTPLNLKEKGGGER